MVADRLPCSLVHIDHSPVEEVVAAGKYVKRSEDLESHLVTILDEVSEHVIVARPLYAFPVSHIRSYLTVIEDFTHDRLYVHHDVSESKILTFLKVELDGIRM